MKLLLVVSLLILTGCQTAAPAPVLPPPALPAPLPPPVAPEPAAPASPALEQKIRRQAQYIEALLSQNDALTARLTASAAPPPAVPVVPLPALPPKALPPPAPVTPTEPFVIPNADGVIDLAAVAVETRPGEPVNPFAVRVAPVGAGREVTLQVSGILAGAVPCAVINDRPVEAGETVDSFTVERIEPDAVWLRHAGRLLRLPVTEKPARVRLPL